MNESTLNSKRSTLDKVAVVLSGICLLHCLALPILLTAGAVSSSLVMDEEIFHFGMLAVILPVSAVALSIGCRQHKDMTTMVLGAVGLAILTVTAFFGHDLFGVTGERYATSIGGIVLAAAHIQNYRVCRRDDCEHDH